MLTVQDALAAVDAAAIRRSDTIEQTILDGAPGFEPGRVWLVAGARRSGLTTLGLTVARALANSSTSVLLALGKDGVETVTAMLLSAESSVDRTTLDRHLFRGGTLEGHQAERLRLARERLLSVPLRLMDPEWLTRFDRGALFSALWDDPSSRARVLVVDDAQRWPRDVRPDAPTRLEQLAVEWGATVVVLHSCTNPRPARSRDAAREWRAWTGVADVTVVLDRPDSYDRESPDAGELHLQLASSRGPLTMASLALQAHYARAVPFSQAAAPAPWQGGIHDTVV